MKTLKEKVKNIYLNILFDILQSQREDIYDLYKQMAMPAILTNDVYYLEKEDHGTSKIFTAQRKILILV